MKRKDDRQCSESRRSFLKTAAAGALIAAGPADRAGPSRGQARKDPARERAEVLLRRYGGEFGDVGRGGA